GQQFIPQSLVKISELRQMANVLNPNLVIEVDGGVSIDNIERLLHAGANALVAGNAVFAAPDPVDMIARLKQITVHTHNI
ncbi:MAG: ribulose-phosphate 3-epimerase, partial [Bacteroidia bacterium]